MAGIKVHGIPMSIAAMRVLAALYEKDLDFELVPVDLSKGEHKMEAFIARNPFGQVPAFEDGDLNLFESRAITEYIADQYQSKGTELLCSGCPKTKAITRVWMEVESQQFDPVGSKLAYEHVVKPMFGMTTDPAVVEENEAKLAKVLDVYEARLSESKYLGCDCFTLADLHHLPVIQYLLGTSTKKVFDAKPKVSAWIADITARPAFLKVLAMMKK